MSNTPFLTEEGDVTTASTSDLADVGANDYPDVYTRLIGSWGPDLKFGVSHWRSLGEPSLTSDIGFAKVPDLKFYLGLENRRLGPVNLRKLYLGNYSITFGQGVVMENTDFFTPANPVSVSASVIWGWRATIPMPASLSSPGRRRSWAIKTPISSCLAPSTSATPFSTAPPSCSTGKRCTRLTS